MKLSSLFGQKIDQVTDGAAGGLEEPPSLHGPGGLGSEGCFAKMLPPIAADGDFKKLECPECRKTTKVLRGKASNLQKNFALLR